MTRCFTRRQRKDLYLRADGRCEACSDVLGTDWHAHHVVQWAHGGLTERTNGQALCVGCHLERHAVMKLRKWQKTGLGYWKRTSQDMLLEACVGAGKTTLASLIARHSLDTKESTFVVIAVPTTELKSSFQRRFKKDSDIEITTVLKDGAGRPREYQGAAITYAQLTNMVSAFEKWTAAGERLLVILDEVHHCAAGDNANVWGAAAEGLRRSAVRALSLTGTPFRPDGRRISFVRYNPETGRATPDYQYTYAQAVAENVCRHVTFIHDDGIAKYSFDGEMHEHRISEAPASEKSRVCGAAFDTKGPRSEFMEGLIAKVDARLDELRTVDPDAACLVICRPGRDEAADDHRVNKVAEAIEALTGEPAVVVTHRDKDASAKIDSFRKDQRSRYIVSVRMISEGIDIPRLRVLLMANVPESELLFRQMVGRVVRQEGAEPEEAYVYMANMPPASDFAQRMREEADCGVRERPNVQREAGEGGGEGPQSSAYQPLGSTHEDGGVTSYREVFTAEEVAEAEAVKGSEPALRHTPLHVILHARKAVAAATPTPSATAPRQERIKARRKELSARLRQLAAIRGGGDAYGRVTASVWDKLGVRSMDDLCDNKSEDRLDAAIDFVRHLITEETARGK